MSRTFCLAVVSLVIAASTLAEGSPLLCARRDRQTDAWKEGSNVRIRSECLGSEIEVHPMTEGRPKHVVDSSGTRIGVVSGALDLSQPVPLTREIDGQTVELSATALAIYGVNQAAPPDVITVWYATATCDGGGFISWSGGFYPSGSTLDGTLYYATGEPRTVIVRGLKRIYQGIGRSGCVSVSAWGPQTVAPYATFDVSQFLPPFRIE